MLSHPDLLECAVKKIKVLGLLTLLAALSTRIPLILKNK